MICCAVEKRYLARLITWRKTVQFRPALNFAAAGDAALIGGPGPGDTWSRKRLKTVRTVRIRPAAHSLKRLYSMAAWKGHAEEAHLTTLEFLAGTGDARSNRV